MNITIDSALKKKLPDFHMAVIEADVVVEKSHKLDAAIHYLERDIFEQYDIQEVINLDIIKEGRDAYKTLGKDPSRYRLAVESLYRRIVKGNPLYRINNIVDIGNVISLETRKSVAMLNKEAIEGDVLIRIGKEDDDFHGIGRGKLNISNIPVYEDDNGPFGSTTSDTDRTKITPSTRKLLMFIISFTGESCLIKDVALTTQYFDSYIIHENFTSKII
ncbi:MAG: phenylalanine--tRNA ligase beta subunit-related protein [Candidatus Izemoplasma sp.]|nr:phenylalanine--tRNA ligase beta subunit-related protein [Candidatus Izemoplasma sp.]